MVDTRQRLTDSPFWDLLAPESREDPAAANLTLGSGKRVTWRCSKGHTWSAPIFSRVNKGVEKGCAACANRIVVVGENDLATTHPALAIQWHPTLNLPLLPSQITAGAAKGIWWQDDLSHTWRTSIRNRLAGKGCAVCAGKTVMPGQTDLATLEPRVASEWHPTLNGNLLPSSVSRYSNKRVWWQCTLGHTWQAPIIRRTTQRSNCPVCAGITVLPGFNDIATTDPELAAQWHATLNNGLTPQEISRGSTRRPWWQCEKGHGWQAAPSDRCRHFGTTNSYSACPTCVNHYAASKGEHEIAEWLGSLIDIKQSTRDQLGGNHELDIYVPSRRMGIEFNGVFWHSDRYKATTYHMDKWALAAKQGIQLLQIWEDDWNARPELVKRTLARKLGLDQTPSVYARKTVVVELDTSEAKMFIALNHLQGFAAGSAYLGLRSFTGQLVAVMILKRERQGMWHIIRYATGASVPGGFTKLLKAAERMYKPARFITFSDHTISDGRLYADNGFVAERELPPDYSYVIDAVRRHKFGYRIKRFRQDPALRWEPGLTERQLAELNGLPRIWDAGKTRWVKDLALMNSM